MILSAGQAKMTAGRPFRKVKISRWLRFGSSGSWLATTVSSSDFRTILPDSGSRPCLPNGPITQLGPYLTRNPCTYAWTHLGFAAAASTMPYSATSLTGLAAEDETKRTYGTNALSPEVWFIIQVCFSSPLMPDNLTDAQIAFEVMLLQKKGRNYRVFRSSCPNFDLL